MPIEAEVGRSSKEPDVRRDGDALRTARRAAEARKPLKVRKDEAERYFDEARGWEANRTANAARRTYTAYLIACLAVSVAIVTSVAMVVLATREPPMPVVLHTNDITGVTEVMTHLNGGDNASYDEVQNKFWTESYIVKREGYLKPIAEDNYNAVGLMSCASERKRYAEWFSPKNPKSPLNVYGDATKVEIAIVSTTFIKPKLALTRFKQLVRRPGIEKPEISYWAATVGFDYAGADMPEKERRVNPLGYQACEYRIDADAASDVNSSSSTAPAAQLQTPTAQATGVQLYPGQAVQVPAPVRSTVQGGQ